MDTPEILRTLVAFDTTSRRSNLDLIHWVAGYLDAHGVQSRLIHSDDGTKANILATIGPESEGGIVLSGHTDVVPVDDQDWDTDPFTLVERDGRFHGRGTADMKGFVAACLGAVPSWSAQNLKRPIHLALSYDEEVGCFGVPRLIAEMRSHVPAPALAIIGEPTQMRVGLVHRGFYGYHTTFLGRSGHSSDPAAGVSSIAPAASLVGRLLSLGGTQQRQRGQTTVNVGRINGGTAINIVPERCDVLWEFRPPDEASAIALRGEIEGFLASFPPGVTIRTQRLAGVPALKVESDSVAVTVALALGGLWPPAEIPFGTEAGFFQQADISALVCGPGAIAQAHQPNEWIAASELMAADRFLANVGAWATDRLPTTPAPGAAF